MFWKTVLTIVILRSVVALKNPQVHISQGFLEGTALETDDGVLYYSFLGIPYAKPPKGILRFQNPLPPDPWEGIRQAKQEGNICMQYDLFTGVLTGDENCLFLNVYTPKLPNITDTHKLPVMVWIHGGGFQSGSGGSLIYGPDWLIEEEVVLVTINYRCGVMGFLSLDIPEAPGNVGLKDQVAALKWVKKNIAVFGGDPNSVTIFGQSAGGASVSYHLLSKLSKGLFHKAISMSGSALNPWAHIANATQIAFKLCETLGYLNLKNEYDILSILQSIPPEIIYEAIGQTPHTTVLADENMLFRELVFLPSIEKEIADVEPFLAESALEKFKTGEFNNVPLMAGYTNKEGLFAFRDAYLDPVLFGLVDVNFERYIPQEICINNKTVLTTAKQIQNFYYGNRPLDNHEDFVNIKTDTWFSRGIDNMIRLIAKYSKEPVYYYMFSYDEFSVTKHVNNDEESEGATHSEDLGYIFKHQLVDLPRNITTVENMRKRMVKMYTNFAKTGNPIPGVSNLLPVMWKPVTNKNLYNLDINTQLRLLKDPKKRNMSFWNTLIEKYGSCPEMKTEQLRNNKILKKL